MKFKSCLVLVITTSFITLEVANASAAFNSTNFFNRGMGLPSTSGRSSSSSATKSSGPYGVEKSSMDPIPVTVENIPDISQSVSNAILDLYTFTEDSTISTLYPILSNALSNGLVATGSMVGNPLSSAKSVAVQTGVPLSTPYSSNAAILFNLTDMVQHTFDCIIYPTTTSITSYLTNSPSIQTVFASQTQYTSDVASTNLSNCQKNDSATTYTSSGTSVETAKININDILSQQYANDIVKTKSWANWFIINQLTMEQLQSCVTSLIIQNSSSSSSSGGSNAPNTNASTYGNAAAYTNVKCTIQEAVCMMTNAVYGITNGQISKLGETQGSSQKYLKDTDPKAYNDLMTLFTADNIVNLQNKYNLQTTNSSCLGVNASSYASPSVTTAQTDAQSIGKTLMEANKIIANLIKKEIAGGIMKTLAEKQGQASQNYNSDVQQAYVLTATADVNTLLGHNSLIGIPTSSTVCTSKATSSDDESFNEKRLAVEASTFVDLLSDTDSIPSGITPSIPFDSGIAAIGGGIGLLNNANNFSSSDSSTISSNRTSSKQSLDQQSEQFSDQFLSYTTNRSVPLGILNDAQTRRQNIYQIPQYIDSYGNVLNPVSSDPSKSGYIPLGETCTSAEIENFDATYRLKPVASQTDTSGATVETNSWQKGIYTEQSAGILNKEQALLLAEIRYQLYKEQKQLEQELAIESINLLQVLGKNVGNLTTVHSDMVKAVKSWMIGGGGDSQPSGANSGS
ncbi:MAG: hypothetical protein VX335_01755 [Pseudomonadota bacterium]|nr:hypothetical protein [Pseudomonadota bacterium]